MAQFKKGNSGNPAGKPKGAKDKRTALRSMLEPHKDALIKVVVEKALSGDTTALRICLDRLIAPMRSNPIRISKFAGSLAERGDQVMTSIGKGEIGIDEAASLMAVLQSQARIIEATELDKRIAALEQALLNGDKNGNK